MYFLVRSFGWLMVTTMIAFVINTYLSLGLGWPVIFSIFQNSMTDRSLMSSHQYKHGQSSLSIEGDHEKFDAVVFLGVPMQDSSVGFEEDQVREVFAPYCTPTFEMVDIYYGVPSEVKWVNGEEKDSYQNVQYAFDIRSSWDPSMNAGYPEEFNIMDRMFSVY